MKSTNEQGEQPTNSVSSRIKSKQVSLSSITSGPSSAQRDEASLRLDLG